MRISLAIPLPPLLEFTSPMLPEVDEPVPPAPTLNVNDPFVNGTFVSQIIAPAPPPPPIRLAPPPPPPTNKISQTVSLLNVIVFVADVFVNE